MDNVTYQKLEGMFPSCHWVMYNPETNEHTMYSTPKESWDTMTEEERILETKKAFMVEGAPTDGSIFD